VWGLSRFSTFGGVEWGNPKYLNTQELYMRTLFTFAVAIGFMVGATGPLLNALDSIHSYNHQAEQALITIAAK
jgi:hypothetical protein